jgi:hypothetical protein
MLRTRIPRNGSRSLVNSERSLSRPRLRVNSDFAIFAWILPLSELARLGGLQVLPSLWPVRDRATAELMQRFYRAMLQDRLAPTAALRQAQIALWKKQP